MPRILVLSANFGSGHLHAARAIAAACQERSPDSTADAVNVDSLLLRGVSGAYLSLLNRAPATYRDLYHAPVGSGVRRLVRIAFGPAVRRQLQRTRPSLVIATHPFPGGVAAWMRRTGRLQAPVVMALTDFVPHGFWVDEGVDQYCVASEETAVLLRLLGAPAGRITVTGIPIRSEFGEQGTSPALRPGADARQVLVMGGGLGLGPITEAVRSLALLPHPDLRITVICGSNRALRQELTDLFGFDRRITLLGYTDAIAALMSQADLLVSKPGGITCSEALACRLPSLLLPPLPGHEEENAAFLTRTGAALRVDEEWIGQATAALLFEHPDRLAAMRESARLWGRPQAARAIANQIFILSTPNQHGAAIG